MSDNSFYGGLRGASFIIVARYPSVANMIQAFASGGLYTAVKYDEYVIIDTENKNDPDNGKIYRRGYSYDDEMGGAIYVGQVVGPSGTAPLLEMTTYKEAQEKQAAEGYDYRKSHGEYYPVENLVPGKIGDGTVEDELQFNDSIKWYCTSIRDEFNIDTIAYIGFIFPYLVVDYTASSVDPYYNRNSETENFVNQNLIVREDSGSHPYWEKWHVSIPKGIKGDAFKNLRVIKASQQDGVESYEGKEEDEEAGREILVYDYYCYDKDESGEPTSLYLGDNNMIDNILINDNGTIRISYTHDDEDVWENLIKWINHVEVNPETGHFKVVYNYAEKNGEATQYDVDLTWVKSLSLDHNGVITVNRTTDSYTLEQKLRWIDSLILSSDGLITVNYNTGEQQILENPIKWITDVKVNTDSNQKLHITYNTGEEADIGEPLNYIKDMAVCPEDFHLLVYYSDPALRQQIVAAGHNHEYQGKNDWLDLGTVKDQDGILVGLNINETILSDFEKETVINYLNNNYPRGLTRAGLVGKVVTAGESNGEKSFYAFDYDSNSWYYLGSLSLDISIDEDGTIHIGPIGSEVAIYDKMIKWIESVILAQNGTFIVHYNNDTPDYEAHLKWVKDIVINDDASISIKYNNGDTETKYENWIESFAKRLVTFASAEDGAPADLIPFGVWYEIEE